MVVIEIWFSKDELLEVDEVWLIFLSKEVVLVVEVDGKFIGIGEVGDVWEKVIKVYYVYKFKV